MCIDFKYLLQEVVAQWGKCNILDLALERFAYEGTSGNEDKGIGCVTVYIRFMIARKQESSNTLRTVSDFLP